MEKDIDKIIELLNEDKIDRDRIVRLLNSRVNSSLEEDICISKLNDDKFKNTVKHILEEIQNPFVCNNEWDTMFYNFLKEVKSKSIEEMVSILVGAFNKFKSQVSFENVNNFIKYFDQFKFWGSFDPENGDYTTFRLRAENIKMHLYDYLHLYRRLEDYLSKRTLLSILLNWAMLDMKNIHLVKSIFKDYYEPDIFPDNKDDVFVDCGAYIGDSIFNYLNSYGVHYKKIYAYEVSKDTIEVLNKNIEAANVPNVIVKNKGVGCENGFMYIESNIESSANKLTDNPLSEKVEIVKLDDDIDDKITFIKMDIEGAEKDALKGAARTIKENMPKLAICVYHGYDDLLDIPELIDSINPNYKFYLRHNGGNAIPTEFVLLCKPNK